MGYVLILLGLGVLGVALAALIRGQIGWARIPRAPERSYLSRSERM